MALAKKKNDFKVLIQIDTHLVAFLQPPLTKIRPHTVGQLGARMKELSP